MFDPTGLRCTRGSEVHVVSDQANPHLSACAGAAFDVDQVVKAAMRILSIKWRAIAARGSGLQRAVFEEHMNMLKIPHDALVFVGDGRKALFLRNDGDAISPNLRTEKVFEEENPPTLEQGSDRPGRVSEAALAGRRKRCRTDRLA